MAVADGRVAWVGGDDDGRSRFPDAETVHLDGAFVAPAFVDNHVHVTATGLTLTGLDLRAATSLQHCRHLLADYARTHPEGPIWAHGWDETAWPQPVPPTTDDVDAAVGNRPAYIARVDVHSAAASSALRHLAPKLNRRNGFHPQQPLVADAHHDIRAAARSLLTAAQRAEARIAALDAAAALGIVAVHECAGPDIGGLDDWRELRDTDHPVDVVGYWGQPVRTADEAIDLLASTGARDLFVDGALGSRTAWLSRPYADAPHCGNSYLSPEAITAHVLACTQAGIPAGFHVIGDAAVSAVVDAFAVAVERCGLAALCRCGHRLEHLEMIRPHQAQLLAEWGVTASVQPNFDALWGGASGMYAHRLGADRACGLNPLALLASQGVPLAFGSDSPVTSMNPWVTVRAAVHHQTPGSAVSLHTAIKAATGDCALVPGAPASYAVWDAHPRLDDDRLPRCLRTVHRGEVIYG